VYWAVGRIRYSQVDKPAQGSESPDHYDGVLVYLKPTIYGDEPPDVYNYARQSPSFPHESTANQFFTESQFESYRSLGIVATDRMCEALGVSSGDWSFSRPLGWLAAQRQGPARS